MSAPARPAPPPKARRVIHACLLAACLAQAAGCARAGGGASPPAGLSREDRLEIFDGVWRAIDEGYYDPSFNGADWPGVRARYRPRAEAARSDGEFYSLLEVMLTELRDGHTAFFAPSPAGPARGPRSVGLSLGEAEGRVVVVEVEAGSDAERAGVRPGMTLLAVNGTPVEVHFARIRAAVVGSSSERSLKWRMLHGLLYGGFLENPRRLTLADFDGRGFEVELSPAPAAPRPNLTARRRASGLAYIHFRAWQPPVEREFERALAEMSDAPGLVIDLRDNDGGRTEVQLDVASNFFPEETYFGAHRGRDGVLKRHFTARRGRVYRGPVVILVDENTVSASETFTVFMQEAGRARAVGRPSAGSTLDLIGGERHFKGGGKLLFSTHAYVSPRGRNPEGVGVVPDVAVPLTVSDLRAGRDAALEAAEALLLRRP